MFIRNVFFYTLTCFMISVQFTVLFCMKKKIVYRLVFERFAYKHEEGYYNFIYIQNRDCQSVSINLKWVTKKCSREKRERKKNQY